MHRENNFNRYESSNVHNIVDNMIKKDHLEIYKPTQTQNAQTSRQQFTSQPSKFASQPFQTAHQTQIVNKDHTSDINAISEQIKHISNSNQRLMEELNKMKSENDKLRGKMTEMENVRMVKLVPKKEGKQPQIISEEEFQNIQKLKNTIELLEKRYIDLEKDEQYDEKLLMNHKERIELLKDKLRTSLHK